MMYFFVINIILYLFIVLDDGGWFIFFECIYLEKGIMIRDFVFFKYLVVSFFFVYVIIVGIVLE